MALVDPDIDAIQRIDLHAHRVRMRNAVAADMHAFARWDLHEGDMASCAIGVDWKVMAIVEGGLCWRDGMAQRQQF
ncbi:hypothetical protein GOZ83_19645 [Agrobacterium vitis]|uniref:hypothetical protein n=1 Tax=Agrobacterium vitis TaxID=373 RepID=UPI0012E85490|nr:hypothetical protein [Agrobacterium vitis]MVA47272.1 hypothetical protein [Agrobacterium vitis]